MATHGRNSTDRSSSPSPAMRAGIPRLLAALPRKFASVTGWVCLLYVAWRYLTASSLKSDESLTCRPRPYEVSNPIGLPKTSDVGLLSATWIGLESIFKAHPPHPKELPKIAFQTGYDMPSWELIQNHTNLSAEDAQFSRASHAEVLKKLPEYPKKAYSGRGLIMLAGGRYNMYAATALGVIRQTGSKLPIEVWMNDTAEEKEGWCDELAREGMVCKWLSDYAGVEARQQGYQLKVMTMMFSSFEQFLFLDADNQPIKNPDTIFDSNSFVDTGAILWPDYWGHTGAPYLPYVVGLSDEASDLFREDRTVESGQIVWDKKRHWKSLCLAAYYNYHGPRYYYTLITQNFAGWGDKDTFPLALKALREDYYMVPFSLDTLFLNGTSTGVAMMQADPGNQTGYEPLFLHANFIKWHVREFLCIGCAGDDVEPVAASDLERDWSPIHNLLMDHMRLYDFDVPEKLGIDPEPMIWKSMEHIVCRSVWTNKALCERIRDYMADAFGFRYRTRTASRVFRKGYEIEEICVQR